MRPQRACAKGVDYGTPSSSKYTPFFPPTPPPVRSKRAPKETPEVVSNKRSRRVIEDSPIKPNSPAPKKPRVHSKGKKKDQDSENKENDKDIPTKPIARSKPSKQSSKQPSKQPSKQAQKSASSSSSSSTSSSSSSSTSSSSSSAPPTYIPLHKRALEDPIIAGGNIVGNEIKTGATMASALESDMASARTARTPHVKAEDHRYEELRKKFEDLKRSTKENLLEPTGIDKEVESLIAQMKEDMKELEHDQKVVKKKLKEQAKELNTQKALLEDEKKELEIEKKRVDEEGKEIQIEKRRMERKVYEKECEDLEKARFVFREQTKELETQKTRLSEEARELERGRKQIADERVQMERERQRLAEEHAKEQKRFEAWQREIDGEKAKIEEQRWRWDDEKRNIAKRQEDLVATLKWQLEREQQAAAKLLKANADLAEKLSAATHHWAEQQEKVDREVVNMVKLVNTGEKEADIIKFLCLITGLTVTRLAPNKFECECSNENSQTRVKFEVAIRESEVEYTPIEIIGNVRSECVKESIWFVRQDWPIFLCKIISSVFA